MGFEQRFKNGLGKLYSLEELQKLCADSGKYPYQDVTTSFLDGENWKEYPYLENLKSQYSENDYRGREYHKINEMYVSDMGRVKIVYNDESGLKKEEILGQIDDLEGGYLRLPKYPGFGNVYRLVADTWLEPLEGKNIVHHIDNNGYNNRAINLIWVDNKEHGLIHGFK